VLDATGKFVLYFKAPAPPPPPLLVPAPPPPPTTRYSTVLLIAGTLVTLKVPDDVKMCAL
jgi:hypothetical protein